MSRRNEAPPPPGAAGSDAKYEVPFAAAEEGGINPALLGSVGVLLLVLLLIILRLVKLQWDEAAARKRTAALLAMAEAEGQDERRGANVAGGRRRNVRRRVNYGGGNDEDNGFMQQMLAEQMGEDGEGFDENGDPLMAAGSSNENIGKKKAMKLEAKAAKKAAREQDLIEREERKKREKEREDQMEKERERERAEEAAREEAERREREEREKRELEEYLRLKESFAVQEEGFDQIEEEETENLMRNFVKYVKDAKVVNMDELAAHFSLKTEEAIDRLNYFLTAGDLTGVMDDRGKFIYVTHEEMQAVAKFINQRGRVTISELADYSNQLIKLDSC